MYGSIRGIWLGLSLKKKLGIYVCLVILVIGISAAFSFFLMDFALGNFNVILDDNSRCYDFQEAMEQESRAFENYIRDRSRENGEQYEMACQRSELSLRQLPYDYSLIGAERYGRTWSVCNAYEKYQSSRDEFVLRDQRDGEYIESLYQIYAMQGYLRTYARQLLQLTMVEGDASYQRQVPVYYRIPYLILLGSVALIGAITLLTRILSHGVVDPMEKLADATRKIAVNDFTGEDLAVDNQDEMGEMVRAFNKMKHATEGYIQTLMKNHEISELLHREEMEKIRMEKRLEAARLELLKSQINPHFLFNTLNIIACMAKLEDASTTERMITSMSNLFRYNLKTTEQIVPLGQEIRVVRDYMYIQQMRFGDRIQYDCQLLVDEMAVKIPAFTLQPLVENAIVHGIGKKEQGGTVYLRVRRKQNRVIVLVADTGVGMDEEKRRNLEEALEKSHTAKVGIGLGNIYQRIHAMYRDGEMRIYSRKGQGTVIWLEIPQEEIFQEETFQREISRKEIVREERAADDTKAEGGVL